MGLWLEKENPASPRIREQGIFSEHGGLLVYLATLGECWMQASPGVHYAIWKKKKHYCLQEIATHMARIDHLRVSAACVQVGLASLDAKASLNTAGFQCMAFHLVRQMSQLQSESISLHSHSPAWGMPHSKQAVPRSTRPNPGQEGGSSRLEWESTGVIKAKDEKRILRHAILPHWLSPAPSSTDQKNPVSS